LSGGVVVGTVESSAPAGAPTRPLPGWYTDHDAEPGWQRYWNGEGWTEGRRQWVGKQKAQLPRLPRVPSVPRGARVPRVPRVPVWGLVATAALAACAGVVVFGGDEPATSAGRHRHAHVAEAAAPAASVPPPASTPGPPPSEQQAASSRPARAAATYQVASVVDGRTLKLTNGAEVRLVGVDGGCTPGAAADWLRASVTGKRVALTRDGADKDAAGHVRRYASLHGVDLGLEMIRGGVATAAPGHARAAAYARAQHSCA
jgi:endonuclease YncB( thermonuclease family)